MHLYRIRVLSVVVLVARTNISVGCYRKSLRAAGLTTIDPIATSTIRSIQFIQLDGRIRK